MQKRPFHSRADLSRTAYRMSSSQVTRVMASSAAGARAGYSTSSVFNNEPVVSIDWLHANLREPDMKVHPLACSFYFFYLLLKVILDCSSYAALCFFNSIILWRMNISP